MKTIQTTIKKLTIIAMAATCTLNMQAAGYYDYCKSLFMPRYEIFKKTSTETLQKAQSAVKTADEHVTEYATDKQPWFKDHMHVLTGIKIGAALTTIVATCWTLKKTYNKLQGLRAQQPRAQQPEIVTVDKVDKATQTSGAGVKSRIAQFNKVGVTYGIRPVISHSSNQKTGQTTDNNKESVARKARHASRKKPAHKKVAFVSTRLSAIQEDK